MYVPGKEAPKRGMTVQKSMYFWSMNISQLCRE